MANILVIDDDDDVLVLISTVLKRFNHTVHALSDGRQALEIHKKEPIDLIITDILMPEVDGIEVIRKFRREYPQLKIIAISGGGWTEPQQFLAMASRLGADATFNKPFEWDKLVGTVNDLLGLPAIPSDAKT